MRETKFVPFNRHRPPEFALNCSNQDEVIDRIFEIVGHESQCLIDVGIGDSWHEGLAHRNLGHRGWRALFIEHTLRSAELLSTVFANEASVTVKHQDLQFPRDENVLDGLISDHFPNARLDMLGLRLKGPEWQALDVLQHRPRLLAILFNPSIPPNIEYVQEDGPNINKGVSLKALEILCRERGYELAHVGRLAIFVDADEFGKLGLNDNSIGRLWDYAEWQTRMMIGFEGRILLAGNRKMLWNRLNVGVTEFDENELQVIPTHFQRLFW